jgi:hypothetical protein
LRNIPTASRSVPVVRCAPGRRSSLSPPQSSAWSRRDSFLLQGGIDEREARHP